MTKKFTLEKRRKNVKFTGLWFLPWSLKFKLKKFTREKRRKNAKFTFLFALNILGDQVKILETFFNLEVKFCRQNTWKYSIFLALFSLKKFETHPCNKLNYNPIVFTRQDTRCDRDSTRSRRCKYFLGIRKRTGPRPAYDCAFRINMMCILSLKLRWILRSGNFFCNQTCLQASCAS
jgi:hypothetical protein